VAHALEVVKKTVMKKGSAPPPTMWSSPDEDAKRVHAAFVKAAAQQITTPAELDELGRYVESDAYEQKVLATLKQQVDDGVPQLLHDLRRKAPAMLRNRHRTIRGFERRLQKAWAKPLNLFEALWVACAEVGPGLSAVWPWGASADDDLVFDVLRRLQARGCEVAGEVHTLLRSGYASAAHARWRTLHETAVTAYFVAEHGRDVAEQYRLHEYVEAWAAADKYQKHCARLGQPPHTAQEMAAFKAARDEVVSRFHPRFGDQYGWAAAALGRLTMPRVGFVEIEKAVKMDHWRPYYQMASHPVHANPKAITFSLGRLRGDNAILTGPSMFGLTDPCHAAAIALMQLTTTLLMRRPGVDSLVTARTMGLLVDEIGREALAAAKAVEARAWRQAKGARSRRLSTS
jgi:hypothetical protein